MPDHNLVTGVANVLAACAIGIETTVESIVRSGKGGTMPSFAGQLSDAQIAAVANDVVAARIAQRSGH